jgi:HEAT repeat protein
LLKALRDPSIAVRNEAILDLSEEPNPQFLPFLAEALASEKEAVRQGALGGLARLAPDHPEAVSLILGAMDDPAGNVRYFAALSLAALGASAVPHLRAALKHESPGVRAAAVRSLAWGEFEEVFEESTAGANLATVVFAELEAVLKDPSAEVRELTASALGHLARWSSHLDSRLLQLLESDDPRVQAGGARALLSRGALVAGAANRILDLIPTATMEVEIACLQALGLAQEEPETILPAIIKALRSESEEVKSAAVSALRSFRDLASGVHPGLAGMVVDRSLALPVRRAALHGLAVTGAKPEVVAAALEAAVRERELGSTVGSDPDGEDPLASTLFDLLKTAAFDEQAPLLLGCLAVIPGKLAEALPAFLERPGVGGEHHVLFQIGGQARQESALINALIQGLRNERTRLAAVRALGYAGEAARSSLPELKRLGRGASPELADALSWAVDQIQMQAAEEP